MRKVLLITPFPPPMGGISNWSKLVYEYINNNEQDVEVKYINTAPKKRSTEGRTFFNRVFNGFFSMFKTAKLLKRELKSFKPDVVHINTSGSLALFRDNKVLKILKRKKIKSILHLRFGRVPELLKTNNLESKLLKKAFKLADNILSIDANTYNSLLGNYSGKALLIPNPFVRDNMPTPIKLNKDNLSYNISFLGWVVKTKGIEELIAAWNIIYKKNKNWKLQIIGPCDKEYFEYLSNNMCLDGIDFMGEKSHDDAMNIVNKSDVFTLPSYTEGFPNAVVEAMYLGKAIVATNVGAIPEMLENNCGIVVKSKSIDELVDAFEKVINNHDLLCQLGENAQEKSSIYSIQNVMEQYKNIWFK